MGRNMSTPKQLMLGLKPSATQVRAGNTRHRRNHPLRRSLFGVMRATAEGQVSPDLGAEMSQKILDGGHR